MGPPTARGRWICQQCPLIKLDWMQTKVKKSYKNCASATNFIVALTGGWVFQSGDHRFAVSRDEQLFPDGLCGKPTPHPRGK